MITEEENRLICEVEGPAPMGQLMRRHWIPALRTRSSTRATVEFDLSPHVYRYLGLSRENIQEDDQRVPPERSSQETHCLRATETCIFQECCIYKELYGNTMET